MPVEKFRIDDFIVRNTASGTAARLGLCRLPGRSGELEADLIEIARWAPALVVSMTERTEMDEKGAAGLTPALARLGIAHMHFPVRDFSAPEMADARWPAIARQLHGLLDQGQGLLLHCLGGKGRSGMVAMRLLVERGMEPASAQAMVRAARPGAIETDAQAGWAADGRLSHRKSP